MRCLPSIGFLHLLSAIALFLAGGCAAPSRFAEVARERDSLAQSSARLERTLAARDGEIAQLRQQVEVLQRFGPDRPLAAFAPVKAEIASQSGGADYDRQPGDDGITVYVRLRDADGDLVKAPGQIRVQLLDNTDLASPAPIAVLAFTDLAETRKLWFGRFGSYHYTLKVPFPPNAKLPSSRRLLVLVEFVDYMTGATLSAVQEVRFSQRAPG